MATQEQKYEEKKRREMKELKRQNVLLRHATEMYLNEDMTLSHKSIVYQNVLELMEVTKINKELAVKFLNNAMRQGHNSVTKVKFVNNRYNKLVHSVTEKCIHCEKDFEIENGLDKLCEEEDCRCDDESGVSCLINYQEFLYTFGKENHLNNWKPYGRIKRVGYCVGCLPKDVMKCINKDDDVSVAFEEYSFDELWSEENGYKS